jgi:hypothetical protein
MQRRPLFVGSAKPHASSSAEAQGAAPPIAAASTASIRTLEPELEEVLRLEPMPDANRIEQTTEWEEPLDGASRHALESGAELVGAAAGGPAARCHRRSRRRSCSRARDGIIQSTPGGKSTTGGKWDI